MNQPSEESSGLAAGAGREPCACDNLHYLPPDASGRRSIFIPENAWADEPVPPMPRDYGLEQPMGGGGMARIAPGNLETAMQDVSARPYRESDAGMAANGFPRPGPARAERLFAPPDPSDFMGQARSTNPNVSYLPGFVPMQRSTFLGESTMAGPGTPTLAQAGLVAGTPILAAQEESEKEGKGGPHAIPEEVYKPVPGKAPDTKWENPTAGTEKAADSKRRYKAPKSDGPEVNPDPAPKVAEVLEDFVRGKYVKPPIEPKRLPCPNSKMRYFTGIYWWESSLAGEFWEDDSKERNQAAIDAAKAAVAAVKVPQEVERAESDGTAATMLLRYMKDTLRWTCDPPCELTTDMVYMRLQLTVRGTVELSNDPLKQRLYYKVWLVRHFTLEALADFWCAAP
ncbi:MAG: hypothetical protein KF754_11495 [Planctomycetes bacterium]|nr:hypothetical protein [Planctomycetota bacterium]